MILSPKARSGKVKLVEVEDRLVARLVLGVELLVVFGVVDVQLIRADSNDRAWKS